MNEIDWNAPPKFCPRCGSGDHLHLDVDESIDDDVKVVEPQSGNRLSEHQCHSPRCEGASFWM